MKKNKAKKTPRGEPSPAAKRVRKGLHIFGRALNFVGDTAAGTVGAVFKIIGTVLLILLVSGMMFACVFAYYVKTCLTPNLDLSLEDFKLNESSTVWYQDASGEWRELANLSGKEKRVWVDYDEIPWYMEKALVAIEDKRFYNHKGVDWYRTAGAFVEMFARMQTSYGGSTITQQLIKNLTGENEVTIQRKLTEIFGALELEKKYDKREIMEWYLNAVYFGEGCWGVQTAAQTYFGKDVKDLSMAECAAIVGITNLPTYYDPFYNEENNKKRQETILWEMYDQGYIDHAQYEQAKSEELAFTRTPGEEYTQEIMSYYTEMVIDDVINDLMKLKGIGRDTAKTLLYNGGYQIYCCLDTGVQACIDQIYTNLNAIPYTRSEQQLQSAIVVMDPYDGRILGISGGVGEKVINFGLNRATGTYRSPGSSIKPIASYGPAVDLGLITPDTLVLDENDIALRGTSWFPQNDGGQNFGLVTIDYRSDENRSEEAITGIDYGNGFQSLRMRSSIRDVGSGVYLKVGFIARPTDGLRIGAAIQTPTLFDIREVYQLEGQSVANNKEMVKSSPKDEWFYRLKSPFRANVGVAYTIAKMALLSADYEYTDYSGMKLVPAYDDNYYFDFTDQNLDIKDFTGPVHAIRLGAEIKPAPELALRVGYNLTTGAQYNKFEDGRLIAFTDEERKE